MARPAGRRPRTPPSALPLRLCPCAPNGARTPRVRVVPEGETPGPWHSRCTTPPWTPAARPHTGCAAPACPSTIPRCRRTVPAASDPRRISPHACLRRGPSPGRRGSHPLPVGRRWRRRAAATLTMPPARGPIAGTCCPWAKKRNSPPATGLQTLFRLCVVTIRHAPVYRLGVGIRPRSPPSTRPGHNCLLELSEPVGRLTGSKRAALRPIASGGGCIPRAAATDNAEGQGSAPSLDDTRALRADARSAPAEVRPGARVAMAGPAGGSRAPSRLPCPPRQW